MTNIGILPFGSKAVVIQDGQEVWGPGAIYLAELKVEQLERAAHIAPLHEMPKVIPE